MNDRDYQAGIVLAWFGVAVLAVALWYGGRLIHYNMVYKGLVEDTVREMVVEDAIKEGEDE